MEQNQTGLRVVCEAEGGQDGCFRVQVWESSGRLVGEQYCPARSAAVFPIPSRGEYTIRVSMAGHGRCTGPLASSRWVRLSPQCSNTQYFRFDRRRLAQAVRMHFTLTDRAYPHLPIEKGELTIWPNIQ